MLEYVTLQGEISRNATADENTTQVTPICMKNVPLAESDIILFLEPMIAVLNAFVRK